MSEVLQKKKLNYTVETNVNSATVGFTNIMESENITNEFFIMSGKIITPHKTIDIGFMEIVLFPEIQLKSFITNTNLMEIIYKGIRTETQDINTLTAKKLPPESKDSDIIAVEMTIENVPAKAVRFLYYFNKEGVAVKKEGFFGFSKKPKFTLVLQPNKKEK
ncbi:MAG: hypothetical protein ACRCTJ_06895 [Brevinema sp.]